MRLIARAKPQPLYYLLAAVGSLLTVILAVVLLTGDLETAGRAVARISITDMARVFAVVAVIALSGVVSYRSGLWNIGQEGQAVIGALAAIASQSPLEAMALAAALSALWVLGPALLRSALEVNEAVATFLMAFVAIYLARFFTEGALRDPEKKGFITTVEAPHMDLIYAFILLGLIAAGVVALYATRPGLHLRLLSAGTDSVKYAGASPRVYILIALTLSGVLAGVGGAVEIMTRETGRYMTVQQVSAGFGLYGISAAWLGGLHPLGVLASSLYIAWLYEVAINLKVVAGLPALVANAMVGASLAWGLLGHVLYKYRVVWR